MAWIEMTASMTAEECCPVALFTRAWIEITQKAQVSLCRQVALFTRAWIEIPLYPTML